MVQHFSVGATCEDLRKRFEKDTSLNRQSFYDALKYVKEQHWFVGGGKDRWEQRGQLYSLNPDGSWKPPPISVGEQLEIAKRNNDRLECLAGSQAQQIEGLQDEIESLRDWSSGSANGVAVSNLAQIVSDSSASTRQRLRAAAVVLGYRVQDAAVIAFTKGFLESLCANADIATDYRIEAGELLRRTEDAMIRPPIERARTDDPAKVDESYEPLADLVARQRARADAMRPGLIEQTRKDNEAAARACRNGGNGDDHL
jgi:hypothetical protein